MMSLLVGLWGCNGKCFIISAPTRIPSGTLFPSILTGSYNRIESFYCCVCFVIKCQ